MLFNHNYSVVTILCYKMEFECSEFQQVSSLLGVFQQSLIGGSSVFRWSLCTYTSDVLGLSDG